MREEILLRGTTHYNEECQKISEIIKQRKLEIAKKYESMTYAEAELQAIVQLMQEEKIPLLKTI